MADKGKRKGGGGRLTRTETVTVRLDPKLRYLAELGARKQRRTLSSYIEWAIEGSLEAVIIKRMFDRDYSIADESANLWDVDEADRFAKLALLHPELLTHEEQIRWKEIRENGFFWRGCFAGEGDEDCEWVWRVDLDSIRFDKLRNWWDIFKDIGAGEETKEVLPDWAKTRSETAQFNNGD